MTHHHHHQQVGSFDCDDDIHSIITINTSNHNHSVNNDGIIQNSLAHSAYLNSQNYSTNIEDGIVFENINPNSNSYHFHHYPSSTNMIATKDSKRLARVFLDTSQLDDQQQQPNEVRSDCNANIYTEPTVINTTLTNQQPPPQIPYNFSESPPSMNNAMNDFGNESLTIVGQDIAITLRQGQLTQTLLANAPSVNSAAVNEILQTNPRQPTHIPKQNQQVVFYPNRIEFLPLCDLLFNIISLAAYFCDVVFDSVTAYTLYLNRQFTWLSVSLFLILMTAIISQILSYRWYRRDIREQYGNNDPKPNQHCSSANHIMSHPDRWKDNSSQMMIIIHLLQCGVLWRYFKLFAPVNLATVKREVSELCILRMVHAFFQAGPMLLLQTYLVWRKPSLNMITDLNIISIFLSLFSICWALSSFNKNIRPDKIHRLVLTWFGVIFQFFWRVGFVFISLLH